MEAWYAQSSVLEVLPLPALASVGKNIATAAARPHPSQRPGVTLRPRTQFVERGRVVLRAHQITYQVAEFHDLGKSLVETPRFELGNPCTPSKKKPKQGATDCYAADTTKAYGYWPLEIISPRCGAANFPLRLPLKRAPSSRARSSNCSTRLPTAPRDGQPRRRRPLPNVPLRGSTEPVPVGGPLPGVAGHVEQAVLVGRKLRYGGDADVAIASGIAIRDVPWWVFGHPLALGPELIAPHVGAPRPRRARQIPTLPPLACACAPTSRTLAHPRGRPPPLGSSPSP